MSISTSRGTGNNRKDLLSTVIRGFLAEHASFAGQVNSDGRLYVITSTSQREQVLSDLEGELHAWQLKSYDPTEPILEFSGQKGPIWIMQLLFPDKKVMQRNRGKLAPSYYAMSRDLAGEAMEKLLNSQLDAISVHFREDAAAVMLGTLVGMELAAYTFNGASSGEMPALKLHLEGVTQECLDEAIAIATGTNLARHLVNLPPNVLYPDSYATAIKGLFENTPGISVEIWDEAKLATENMNLMLAVGGASAHQPRLVKICYRPGGENDKKAPIVLVGKGITFDSGGLDLKPASNMRLMKKDMGGSAAIVGAFYSLIQDGIQKPMDLYLALAENAISSNSFRPSDVITSRSGKTVEIHNTDAEGRLVLADALALAKEQAGDERARAIISVATLTGAMKVGLGVGMGGYFASDDDLSEKIAQASQKSGDLMWEVPLFDGYTSLLKTQFADINHCATGSFGGAITAALFLHSFVDPTVFAHFDIYSWNDNAVGALREVGGSGQAVQCLRELVKSY